MSHYLTGESPNHPIKYYSEYMHSMSVPMNDIMWYKSANPMDKAISFVNFKFVEYNEYYNEVPKPFKRR